MVMVSSTGSLASVSRRSSNSARSGLPGAYPRTGSFTGVGTHVTASNGYLPRESAPNVIKGRVASLSGTLWPRPHFVIADWPMGQGGDSMNPEVDPPEGTADGVL